jgi:hypothetical protein
MQWYSIFDKKNPGRAMARFAPYVAPPLIFSTTACIDPFLSLILLTNTLKLSFTTNCVFPIKLIFELLDSVFAL